MSKNTLDDLLTAPLLVLQEKSRENAVIALCTNWLMGAKYVSDDRVPTAYTDGIKVAGNREFFTTIGHNLTAQVFAHESLHAILGHVFATKEFGPSPESLTDKGERQREANVAMDVLINTMLEKIFGSRIEWKKKDGTVGKVLYIDSRTPEGKYIVNEVGRRDFDPETCDFYWVLRHLDREALKGSGGGDGLESGNDIGPPEDADAAAGHETQVAEKVQRAVAQTQAARRNNKWGDMPGWMERMLDSLSEPKQDWRRELNDMHQSLRPVDYSFRRLKSPYIYMGCGAPTLSVPGLGEVVFANDTSGSMTDEILAMGISELRAIWQTNRPEKIHVLHVDTVVHQVDTIDPDDTFEVHPKGGGGTDFRPAFQWVKDNMENPPACLIFFTDLYGCMPDVEPDYPVIWLCCPGSDPKDPPFGRVIRME